MKKILQLSNYYFPEIGGIEKIAESITNCTKNEYQMKVLCFTHEFKNRIDYIDGIEIIRCGTKLNIASQALSITYPVKMRKILTNYRPDIIIIHVPNPFTEFFTLAEIDQKVRLIVYWHSDIVKQKLGEKIFHGLTMKLLKRADCVVATSPNYIEGSKYLKRVRDKCVVIPNCINEQDLNINPREQSLAEDIRKKNKDKFICVGIGRQVPYKGFEYLIDAFKFLDTKYELYLLGRKGESTEKIRNLSKNMQNIHLLGEVSEDVKKAYLLACDIFCFPSITKNEAFGLALAEGMYFYKPAVTFTIPGSGVNYVNIDGATGLEVPNRDINAYAKAIQKLTNNEILREKCGNQAGKRVRENFLSKQFSSKIIKLLSNLQ